MPTDVPIRCACGELCGIARGLSGRVGSRLSCYCDDCQSYAWFLGDAGRILDAHGGTAIFQTSPARVEITQGAERLACVRLREGGLLRWYADCCRSPIGNTLASGALPFVGLFQDRLDGPLDELLGPSRGGVHGRFAKGDRSRLDAADRAPLGLILRFLRLALGARLRGDQRRSPFFDPRSGAPIVEPQVLSPDELRAVETARDAA